MLLLPYYHQTLPQIKRLIIIESDMEFHIDPADLDDQFNNFASSNVMGCARAFSASKHPSTEMNTDVLLLDIDRQRSSSEWRRSLRSVGHFDPAMDDRECLDLIMQYSRNLVYVLPCRFNLLLNQGYQQPWYPPSRRGYDVFYECMDSYF